MKSGSYMKLLHDNSGLLVLPIDDTFILEIFFLLLKWG